MKNTIILTIKGFFIGVANIIPGVSGGTLAITLGIYEKLINTISHFFKNFKDNLKFIIPIFIGAVLSILLLSKVISFCLDKYTLATILFFIGLILGGIPLLHKKIKGHYKSPSNIIIFLLTFSFVILLSILKGEGEVHLENASLLEYLKIFVVGMIAAATMIIPGVSGSFVLMLLGYYKPIINLISNLTNNLGHSISLLFPFGLGILVGIVVVAKILEYLFKKHEVKTYFGVLGFVLASIITIFLSSNITFSILQLLIGMILLLIGFITAYKLGE